MKPVIAHINDVVFQIVSWLFGVAEKRQKGHVRLAPQYPFGYCSYGEHYPLAVETPIAFVLFRVAAALKPRWFVRVRG